MGGQDALRVLLIEDDPDDQLLTRDALADVAPGRYRVTCAASYGDGLAQLGHGDHDVVLLDYRLGAQDGLGLLQAALEVGCRAPIIVLTGQSEREIDEAAQRAGAADYLIKGQLTPELLDRSIRYALQRRAAEEHALELAQAQAARSPASRRFNERSRDARRSLVGSSSATDTLPWFARDRFLPGDFLAR
jgi:CheY-like chemotaxis protein